MPSPPKLIGALLVVAMTVGYLATDKVIATRFAVKEPARTTDLGGGPTGTPAQQANSRLSPETRLDDAVINVRDVR